MQGAFLPEAVTCEHCGKPVAANAPSGLCPGCLLRMAMEQGAGRALAPLLPKLRYFGDYELLEEIARGGMGVVYRARQVSLDRTVAVKMMRPGVLSTEDEIRRFQAEARTAASMQHPNIVAIHEVGEFDGLHYFSMDFVEGPSLAELVRRNPLAPREAARYVQVLTAAVQYAHGKGILHRDLKPSNVLVDAEGRPRITDFGLARSMEGGSGITVTGALVGTPAYMPPEQAAAEGAPLSPASDCYSLGAILYELLTGAPPFRGASPVAIARQVVEDEPARPRSVDPNIPRDLEAICMRCLEKDPARRHQSAADLGADLERFLTGEGVQARRASRWLRRWPWAAAALILTAGLLWILARPRVRPPAVYVQHPGQITIYRDSSRKLASATPKREGATKLGVMPGRAIELAPPRPAGLSVDPGQGSGNRQAFTFRYSEPSGAPVAAVEIAFTDSRSERACRLFVLPDAERVELQFDPAKGPGLRLGGKPGASGTLENEVCSLDLPAVTYTRRNEILKIRVPMTFKPPFNGRIEIQSWPLDTRTDVRLPSNIRGVWTVK